MAQKSIRKLLTKPTLWLTCITTAKTLLVKGINLSSIVGRVHAANMAKRDPETGKFLKRADGKIIKPKGWTPPNVEAEIQRQLKEGSFEEINGEAEANMKTPSK